MAAEDLEPTTANSHVQGAASLQHAQVENQENNQPKGNWFYKTKKLYDNQPSKIRYIGIACVIIILIIIVAGIGVAIGKAAGKTEVQHLVIVSDGVKYTAVVVISGEAVQISLQHIKGFTAGAVEIVYDFEQGVTALNDGELKVCLVRLLDRGSIKSVMAFSDGLESSWTDVLNLTESVDREVRWRTKALSSHFVKRPHAADSMDCDSGDYEVMSALADSDPEPTTADTAPIRAGFPTQTTCESACFPRFSVEPDRNTGIQKLMMRTKDCYFYGNCKQ